MKNEPSPIGCLVILVCLALFWGAVIWVLARG